MSFWGLELMQGSREKRVVSFQGFRCGDYGV